MQKYKLLTLFIVGPRPDKRWFNGTPDYEAECPDLEMSHGRILILIIVGS